MHTPRRAACGQPSGRALRLLIAAAGALLASACNLGAPLRALRVTDTDPMARLHVLMIDGGGRREQNYQSHLLHIRELLGLLLDAHVPRAQITIFSSDGDDPADDLAVRDPQLEPDFWLLRGTQLERTLGKPVTFTNSTVPGMKLEPATKQGLDTWFSKAATQLRSGDTLLIYVTDHGTKDTDDTANNRITLWGKDESLSVTELRAMLGHLPAGVRVVSLMSQCFSGAFANLSYDRAAGTPPTGSVCGYFSSTADRPAYGCYPENRGKDNIGHSFDFIQALKATPTFPAAHDTVLVIDRTPDVPLKSTDFYLEDLVRQVAHDRNQEFAHTVDELLAEAWHDKAAWEPEIRLLDRIAHAVGYFSPRSLAELDAQSKLLPDVSDKLRTYADAWNAALGSLAQENLQRFLTPQSGWEHTLDAGELKRLDAAALQPLTTALLADLVPFTRSDKTTDARLKVLKAKVDAAAPAAYRMQVRLGVVLRMRAVLISIAGRVYLAEHGTEAERTAYRALSSCEDLTLNLPRSGSAPLEAVDPFPSYDEEVQLAQHVSPAWMGVRFKQASAEDRRNKHLQDGAAAVVTVFPNSPAQAAGLQVGDVVVGPPGAPFVERAQIREWTMLSKVDRPAPLEVLRDGKRMHVKLVPQPYPLVWPEIPGPPKVGSPAVPLKVDPYRGTPPVKLATGTPHLLFFWATWCGPCKASLPEVLAFERERHTPVVAITEEPREQLDAFFRVFTAPFPDTVAMDAYRRAFVAYGVSGTPTFVLVDGQGTVVSYSTGYSPAKSLGIQGWSWTPPATGAAGGEEARPE